MTMIKYNMRRGNKTVAEVITLDSGKCIVSWPTSVIVYDSEQAARDVHITHMGGRGEETLFRPILSDNQDFMRGVQNAWQDSCEGAPWGTLTLKNGREGRMECPDWESIVDKRSFVLGYLAEAICAFTPRDDMSVVDLD